MHLKCLGKLQVSCTKAYIQGASKMLEKTSGLLYKRIHRVHLKCLGKIQVSCTKAHIQGASKMLGQTSGASSPMAKEIQMLYHYTGTNDLRRTVQKLSSKFSPLDFCPCGQSEPPLRVQVQFKNKENSPAHFLCLSNRSQPTRGLWNSATVHDQKCSCVQRLR